ncbi:MAG: hypothetical protein R2729_30155 [Bryobacteraceae bacterium]
MRYLWLLALVPVVVPAQDVDPAALMNLRFYPANGGFMVERLTGSNLPPGELTFEAVGPATQAMPLRRRELDTFAGFETLDPNGVPVVRLGKPGRYEFHVKLAGRVIGKYGFELARAGGEWTRQGDWERVGFLAQNARDPESPAGFHFWASLAELPPGKSRAMLTAHWMLGGREVAATPSPMAVTQRDWQPFRVELGTKGPKGKVLSLSGLAANDGDYALVVKADGQPWKTFRVRVKGGKPAGLAGYPAHRLDTSSGSNSSYKLMDVYWVAR